MTTAAASSSSATSTGVGGSAIAFSGLASGVDTASIIDQLMNIEKIPQNALKTKLTSAQGQVQVYQSMNTLFANIQTASQALNLGINWKAVAATSSDSSVTATADSTATASSLSFVTKQLATPQIQASFGSVASTSTVIGSGNAIFGMAGSLGFATMHGNGSLTTGAHALAVTTATTGASATGTPVADSTTLTGTETLQYSLDGGATTKSITLTAGTYTQKQLADMISQQSGGALTASVNANKSLSLATTREGSAASLTISGGTGLTALGLATGATTHGTNGVVTVDGVSNTITDTGGTVTLNGTAGGTISTTFSGGLRVGTANVANVSLGDGKLATVVANINAANLGFTASSVQVSANQFKLQLASQTTGSAGALTTDSSAFASTLGVMQSVQAAQDAKLTVGTGANSYDITSSSNTVTGVLTGVTLTLTSADPTKTINVSVAGDGAGLANKVSALVDAVNTALSSIKSASTYDPTTKSAGVLLGNSTASRLQTALYGALSNSLASTTLGYPGGVGITSKDDGTFTFDKSKFMAAYQANPEAVADAFVEGGTIGNTTLTHPGIAEQLATIAKSATDSVSGMITTAIAGQNSTITDLNTQIADWDVRLAAKQDQLKAQFDAMETALSNLKAQGSWLTSQIASLASNSSSS